MVELYHLVYLDIKVTYLTDESYRILHTEVLVVITTNSVPIFK